MIGLIKAKGAFTQDRIDAKVFDTDFPAFALLCRFATDQNYAEWFVMNANDKTKLESDETIKRIGDTGQTLLQAIPVVGDILSVIFSFVGLDFGSFGAQSASHDAEDNLGHFIDGNLKFSTFISAPVLFNNAMNLLHIRPKCQSPTGNCALEHSRYVARVKIEIESTQSVMNVYNTYFNTENWNEFVTQFRTTSPTSPVPPEPVDKTNKKSAGLLIAGLASLSFLK